MSEFVVDQQGEKWKIVERVPVGLIPVATYGKTTENGAVNLRVYSVKDGLVLVSFLQDDGEALVSYLVSGWALTHYVLRNRLDLKPW